MVTIPGYMITESIHESKTNNIFRGYKQPNGKPVLIKIPRKDSPAPEDIDIFVREYEIIKSLDFDGVVRVYGLEEYNNGIAIIMEDLGGKLLKNLIQSGSINITSFLHIAVQLSEILAKLHRSRIIHKDIKPGNIIFDEEAGRVNIIDFSISTRFPSKNTADIGPDTIDGTLAYMSPEQTGRTNSNIDFRSDLYSMGVTFYEMLTGHLPFETADPLEMVHCHLAKNPIAPIEMDPAIPRTVSNIVMKLLSKKPEDRYQSAYGLHMDLGKCLQQWKAYGRVEYFSLGQEDIPQLFLITEKIYGREKEILSIIDSYNKVMRDQREIVLVGGHSGVGKTSMIFEINDPLILEEGYFVYGKCDQLNRDCPYLSLIQAFRSLIHQLLTESEERIEAWKRKLLKALGINGQVIIDVIPEVELIIGKQPPAQTLPGVEAKNRFNLVFTRFVNVFAQKRHPLVVFLDDLQWADSATLNLIVSIMSNTETSYLFLIGAYQNYKVDSTHPLILAIEEIKKTGTDINAISLLPLNFTNTARIIADTLNCGEEACHSLVKFLFDKTNGNPFFVKQLLKTLYEEGILEIGSGKKDWKWDIEKIESLRLANTVIELVTRKIESLTISARRVLESAACIGNEFTLKELAMVSEKSNTETMADLFEAVNQGLIISKEDFRHCLQLPQPKKDNPGTHDLNVSFRFAHDRVRQAAYQVLSEQNKKELHLKIGQMIRAHTGQEEEKVFDIVNHLNLAASLLKDHHEREQLAQLNLTAGKKAKDATAYGPALKYITAGLDLLTESDWQEQYNLTFNLYLEKAECEFLNIHYEQSEKLFDTIIKFVKTDLDRAKVYKIKMLLYTNMGRVEETVHTGIEALKLFGLEFSLRPGKVQILLEVLKAKAIIGRRNAEDLLDLPEMTDPYKLAATEILMSLTPVAYLFNMNFFVLVVLNIVSLSIKYGNCYVSAFGYGVYGLLIGSGFGRYKDGYEFGRLGLALSDNFNNGEVKSKCNFNFGWFINHWRAHARENITHLKRGMQDGIDNGDLIYAAYCCSSAIVVMESSGRTLQDIYEDSIKYYKFLKHIKNEYTAHTIIIIQRMILALQGLTLNPTTFSSKHFDENIFEDQLKDSAVESVTALYHITKLKLSYLFGDYHQCLKEVASSGHYLPMTQGVLYSTDHFFYHALALAALYPQANHQVKKSYWRMMKTVHKKMKKWADNCPGNFLHKYLLVSAEMARVRNRDGKAILYYNLAINCAIENGYTQIAAIGYELAAKYYLDRNRIPLARTHLLEAQNAYRRWGATAKARDLEEKHTGLFSGKPLTSGSGTEVSSVPFTSADTTGSSSRELDLITIIKSSQAISGEIFLERLLKKLIAIVLENAGAQKGSLILEQNGALYIEAEGSIEGDIIVLQSTPLEDSDNLSPSIVRYVTRTRKPVILCNATQEGLFVNSRYVLQKRPISILCAPVIHQGKLTGVLYLENNLAAGVFTPDRVEVLRLLSSQFVISIENARLYSSLRESKDQLTNAYSQLEKNLSSLREEISRREQMEKEMARLDRLNLVGEMAAGFGHEVRNPMTSVRGFLQLLGGKTDCKSYKEFFNLMIEELDRADSIITEFLSLAKNKAIDLKAENLNSVVRALIPLINADGVQSGKEVRFELQEIPDILIDGKEIRQLLLNLVRNGFEAMSSGGCLTIRTFEKIGEVVLAVQDQGRGITPDILEKMGTPFFTTKDNGTGLGLAVCYSIAARHNATIEVETVSGGTIFSVRFKNLASGEA